MTLFRAAAAAARRVPARAYLSSGIVLGAATALAQPVQRPAPAAAPKLEPFRRSIINPPPAALDELL